MTDAETGAEGAVSLDSSVLGEVTWLMTQSELHRDWPVSSVVQWAVPAIMSKQCRIYRKDGRPVGYVSWAWLSAKTESRFAKDPTSLQPVDWQSGDRLWLIDWIAPWGGTSAIARDLRTNVFPDDVARGMRWKKDSDTLNIYYLHGRNALDRARDHTANPAVILEDA